MKQFILIQPVDAGNGRRKLGLSNEDWREIMNQSIPTRAFVQFSGNRLEEAALNTYRDYGSLTSPQINTWLNDGGYPLNERTLLFEFLIENDRHLFVFMGVLNRNY